MRYVSIKEPTVTTPAVSAAEQTRLDALVVAHLPTVRLIAVRLLRRFPRLPFDDCLQAGAMGLMDAAPRFQPAAGVLFATYVGWRIEGAMLDEIRRHTPGLTLREGQPGPIRGWVALDDEDVAELPQPAAKSADPWLQRHIADLPGREAQILRNYYWGGLRFHESRVSQLHRRAIFHLRAALTAKDAR